MELQPKKTNVINKEKLVLDSLLSSIENSKSSKQWTQREKLKILSSTKDKISKQKLQQAWVMLQLKEVEADPLEEQVVDESGKVLASRHWKCNARSCLNQHYRGNSTKLAIRVETKDRSKLAYRTKQHACLKHFAVKNKCKDYCHNYFKLHKQLPDGAFLKLGIQERQLTPGIPSTSSGYFETQQIEGKITIKICKINIFGD